MVLNGQTVKSTGFTFHYVHVDGVTTIYQFKTTLDDIKQLEGFKKNSHLILGVQELFFLPVQFIDNPHSYLVCFCCYSMGPVQALGGSVQRVLSLQKL